MFISLSAWKLKVFWHFEGPLNWNTGVKWVSQVTQKDQFSSVLFLFVLVRLNGRSFVVWKNFFPVLVFFHRHRQFTGKQGKGGGHLYSSVTLAPAHQLPYIFFIRMVSYYISSILHFVYVCVCVYVCCLRVYVLQDHLVWFLKNLNPSIRWGSHYV